MVAHSSPLSSPESGVEGLQIESQPQKRRHPQASLGYMKVCLNKQEHSQACDPRTQEVGTEGYRVWASLGYIARPCFQVNEKAWRDHMLGKRHFGSPQLHRQNTEPDSPPVPASQADVTKGRSKCLLPVSHFQITQLRGFMVTQAQTIFSLRKLHFCFIILF